MFKTIKKKWISILTLAVMLISLLAGISLPASADGLTLAELDAKYNVHYRYNLFNGTAHTIINNVRNMIADGTDLATIQEADAAADASLVGNVVSRYDYKTELDMYPNYAEWKEYYQPLETDTNYIAHIRIISEDEWLQLVTDTKEDAEGGALFVSTTRNITFHLDAEDGVFDMQNQAMYPVGYNSNGFIANLNGHDQVFKNVNITLDSPTHSVGLISQISIHCIYQNFGIASGKIEVTGAMASGTYIGAIAGSVNSSGGKATAGILRKVFNNAKVIAEKSATNGILGYANTWPIMDGCFNMGWLEVTASSADDFNGAVGGLISYGGNRIRIYNSFANGPALVNTYSEYYATSYHNNVFTSVMLEGDSPIQNCYGGGTFVHYTSTGAEESFDAINAAAKTGSACESAYKLNQNYVAVDYEELKTNYSTIFNFNLTTMIPMVDTDPIYYTLAEDGTVAYGTEENQLRKVTIVDRDGETVKEFYANSNSDVDLNYHLGVNYYALVSGSNATIHKRTLHIGDGDVVVKIAYDVDSGNAYGTTDTINLADAQMILREVVGLTADADEIAGDVNFDGKLDADDAVLLVRYWLGDTSKYNAADYPIETTDGWLKVASYNIKSLSYCPDAASPHAEYWCYGTASEPHVEYPSMYQADEVAAVLNAAGAALIGFQEVRQTTTALGGFTTDSCYSNLNTLASLMEGGSSAWNTSFSYNSRSGTIYYNETGSGVISKYTLSSADKVFFDAQYSAEGEQRMYTRYTISGSQLTDYGFSSGDTLVWYNTHLGSVTREQMAQLGEAMEADYAQGYYVIATGDFNHNPIYFNDCVYGDYSFDISESHFTMANGGKNGKITNGERQQIDNILISDNLEFYWDPATQNAIHRVDVDTIDNFTPDHTAGINAAPAKDGMSYDSTLDYASDHSLVYAYIRVKK